MRILGALLVLILFSYSFLFARIYEDNVERFKINVLQEWEEKDIPEEKKIVFLIDDVQSYLSVSVPSYRYTPAWAAHMIIDKLSKDDSVRHIRERDELIGEKRTCRIDYLYDDSGKTFHVRQTIFEGNERLYVVTFHALRKKYAEYADEVNEIMNKFEVIIDTAFKKVEKEYVNEEYMFSLKYPNRWVEITEGKPENTPFILYIEPEICFSVAVSPIEYMKDTTTGTVFSADRARYAANSGAIIKSASKGILKSIKNKYSRVEKLRQYSSEVDGKLAMELIIEYEPKEEENTRKEISPDSSKIRSLDSDKNERMRALYYITAAGANILSFIYSAPIDKFNYYVDDFESVMKSIKKEMK